MSQPQFESACMLTKMIVSSLLCHNDTIFTEWLKFINNFKDEHAQTQFWSKLEITKCCGDLKHKDLDHQSLINSFLSQNNVSMLVWKSPTGSEE